MRSTLTEKLLESRGGAPFLFDGAMGTMLETADLHDSDYGGYPGCSEILNRTRPEIIKNIHRSYLRAGASAVETNSFGGTRLKLKSWGLESEAVELNRKAALIAREVADTFGGLVIGSMGPSGHLPTSPGYDGPSADEMTEAFREQAEALLDGGTDILLVETSQDILELRCAILGARDAVSSLGKNVPVWCTVSLHMEGRMLMGAGVDAAMNAALSVGAEAFGLNCATGPAGLADGVRFLVKECPVPVILFPNAGMPENVEGKPVFPLEPSDFAEEMKPYLAAGVEIVGGCCGTTPEHTAYLKSVLSSFRKRGVPPRRFMLSSAVGVQETKPEGSPLIIGERLNAQGSRKFRRLILAGDMDGVESAARRQADGGAQVLDVSTAISGTRDEVGDMVEVITKVSRSVHLPLMIDSVHTEVVNRALAVLPGVGIVNSINLERISRSRRILELAVRYGSAVVAMTIDEKGMAVTAEEKLVIAKKLHELATVEYGLPPEAVFFDPLTFTLATGEKELAASAVETIKSVGMIRNEFPRCGVILGISNVSYGLPTGVRRLVNAIFLHHAVKAGLTAAIVNPWDIKGYYEFPEKHRELTEDLIFNRRSDALERLLDKLGKVTSNTEGEETGIDDPKILLETAVIDRRENYLESAIGKLLKEMEAVDILNKILLPAMKEVGDRMSRNETILPHVLKSAEIMRKALKQLEPHLDKAAGSKTGKVILATVFGDVHDIGKNLVKTILSNNGFEIIDLGKQVPPGVIADAVERENPIAVGLSALLVSTAEEMWTCVKVLHERKLNVPVIIGGAAVSPAHAARISTVNGDTKYAGGVHYAPDAFKGLELCRRFGGERGEKTSGSIGIHRKDRSGEVSGNSEGEMERASGLVDTRGKPYYDFSIEPDYELEYEERTLRELLDVLAEQPDGRLAKPAKEIAGEALAAAGAALRRSGSGLPETLLPSRDKTGTPEISPVTVFAFIEAGTDGDAVILRTGKNEIRLDFPRKRGKCLTDWIAHKGIFIPYIATLGQGAIDTYNILEKSGNFALAHEWALLCGALTEAAAVKVRRRAAVAAGASPEETPLGFSPGYSLWPDLSHQEILLGLLRADRLGVLLTSHYQLVPEYSTTGMVILAPDASY